MLRRVLSGALIVLLLLMLHVGLLCAALTSPFHGGMDGGGIEKCLCELARDESGGAPGAPIYGKRVFFENYAAAGDPCDNRFDKGREKI